MGDPSPGDASRDADASFTEIDPERSDVKGFRIEEAHGADMLSDGTTIG